MAITVNYSLVYLEIWLGEKMWDVCKQLSSYPMNYDEFNWTICLSGAQREKLLKNREVKTSSVIVLLNLAWKINWTNKTIYIQYK